jgi:four helix bundle protein
MTHIDELMEKLAPMSSSEVFVGSACELEYHLLLACDLKLLKDAAYEDLNREVTGTKRMLASLLIKLIADS